LIKLDLKRLLKQNEEQKLFNLQTTANIVFHLSKLSSPERTG